MELLYLSWTTTGLIGLFTLVLFYWFATNNHGYWKKQGVPFVKPLPFLGTILDYFRTPLHLLEQQRYVKYGNIYGHYEGNRPMLIVGDPVLLKDIFVKDFATFPNRRVFATGNEIFEKMLTVMPGNEDWKRIRTIVTPTFTTGKIKRMLSIFTDCSKTLIKNFKTLESQGKPVDCKKLYGAFSLDVIASSNFSTKLDSHNDPDNPLVSNVRNIFTPHSSWRIIFFILFPTVFYIMRMKSFLHNIMHFIIDITLRIIEERKRTGQVRNDFLQLLMDTAKEVEESEVAEKEDIASNYWPKEDINPHILKSVLSKKLSMNELVAQSVVFFTAGSDATSSTLSLASYLLALNPDIQDKARTEVDQYLKESNGEVTYEAFKNMKYLDNVISETLRMYPPLTRIERQAEFDCTLGNTGITIKKGMLIGAPAYAMHRDPKLFPDPEKFDPDRFCPEERAKRDPYSYLPFGAGPRNCVAGRFALMEMKVCLAHVIANFVIRTCPDTKNPLQFAIAQGLLQPKGIVLEMKTRKASPLLY